MIVTGIVRRVDEFGRIAIPKEVRRALEIKDGDTIEIFLDRKEGMIGLKKWEME